MEELDMNRYVRIITVVLVVLVGGFFVYRSTSNKIEQLGAVRTVSVWSWPTAGERVFPTATPRRWTTVWKRTAFCMPN